MAKNLMDLVKDFNASKAAIEETQANLPRYIGTVCVKSVKNNFKLQSYEGKPWEPRKETTDKSYTYGRGKKGKSNYKGSVVQADNPILEQTRNLKNSVKYAIIADAVTIGVDLTLIPYAKIHNEGGEGSAFGHPFAMPQRQYMPMPGEPPTPAMREEIGKGIKAGYHKAMSNFKK